MTTKSTSKKGVEVEVSGKTYGFKTICQITGLSEETVRHTPLEALRGLIKSHLDLSKAKSKSNKQAATRQSKSKAGKPSVRANKAAKLMEEPTKEEASWVDLIMEQLVEDPTRSSTEAHRLAGYHTISNKNSYNPECNGARRTISILYRAGLLDAEMERRLALAATETK